MDEHQGIVDPMKKPSIEGKARHEKNEGLPFPVSVNKIGDCLQNHRRMLAREGAWRKILFNPRPMTWEEQMRRSILFAEAFKNARAREEIDGREKNQ